MPLDYPSEAQLAPYAARSAASRGRTHAEPEHAFRPLYQRDRDRVIHSTAFRRLEYKTQVFVNHEGDYYRTRLTHTLEVSQISRTIARALRLNEDLTEAVALAHDLGHTPFGHAGEDVLNELLAAHGGFEHNRQGLRVVDLLERRYAAFPGLNLSYEVREAFVRHSSRATSAPPDEFAAGASPLLEVQATILADEIAYDNHDIDDGLCSGIIKESDLAGTALWRRALDLIGPSQAELEPDLRRAEAIRRLINLLVTDAVDTTRREIERLKLTGPEEVRACPERVVKLSPPIAAAKTELERFLFENFYRHHRVLRMASKCRRFLRELFAAYQAEPSLLPEELRRAAAERGLERTVGDYLAGMTDRHAEDEYRKLFLPFEKS